jgi:1,4-alpha-glucan branching enzyme
VNRETTERLAINRPRVEPLERSAIAALVAGTLTDPFSILGPHQTARGRVIRAFLPRASRVDIIAREEGTLLGSLVHIQDGYFEGSIPETRPYLLRIFWPNAVIVTEDPYSFGLLLGDLDLHLIAEGRHARLASCLGAQWMNIEGVIGVRFAVWAPNAKRVAVIGDFNSWDARLHAMRYRHEAGVWELFVPRLRPGARYKYAIVTNDGTSLPPTADPIALRAELPPETASVVIAPLRHAWQDAAWMSARTVRQGPNAPLSIYEVDLDTWVRAEGAEPTWDKAIQGLLPYVVTLQFTHILLFSAPRIPPHQPDAAGEPVSLFAPRAKYGDLAGFVRFIDACHGASIGVIVDWLPEHFFGSGRSPHANHDSDISHKQDFLRPETLLSNIGRREVQGFLIASALRWLEDFHVDGLRVNALTTLLRTESDPHCTTTNSYAAPILSAIELIRNINAAVVAHCPGAITIAAEATSWPGVTAAIDAGGLGFSYQWNNGFAARTMRYISRDPVHRRWHHDEITFNLRCAFVERYLHGLSHEEVSAAGRGLRQTLPGDDWQQRASLRAIFAFVWSHPGKKLLCMGSELGQHGGWAPDTKIDWRRLDDPSDAAFIALTFRLNLIYRNEPALFEGDARPNGLEWLIIDDQENSVFAYLRRGNAAAAPIAAIVNMTAVPRYNYRVGIPHAVYWREILNTDSKLYGGSNLGNFGGVYATPQACHGRPYSLELTLPPLATVLLRGSDDEP